MKKIRVNISKIKNHFYAKIPDLLVEKMNLSNGHDLEITIHPTKNLEQVEMWNQHPEDINQIEFYINDEVHTMNMYNRIYIPEKYRFFLPSKEKDFLLITNVGTIKTHITSNGYFTKGLRQWFYVNGPLMPKDEISINLIREKNYQYELQYKKNNENNNRTI